jgi:hypothetical protein
MRLSHRNPLCRCRVTYDKGDDEVQTFVDFTPCAQHADRQGRAGYIAQQAEMYALHFAALHVAEEGGTVKAREYDGQRLVFRAELADVEATRGVLTDKQPERDYRLPVCAEDDRDELHEAITAALLACRLEPTK